MFKRLKKTPSSEPIQSSEPLADVPLVRSTSENEKDEYLRRLPSGERKIAEEYFRGPSASGIFGEQMDTMKYFSYFFRKDIVDQFQNKLIRDLKIIGKYDASPMKQLKLYNSDDILSNITSRGTVETRGMMASSDYQTMRGENMSELISYLAKNVCSGIVDTYARSALSRAIDESTRKNIFDILVISTDAIEAPALVNEEHMRFNPDEETMASQESQGSEYFASSEWFDSQASDGSEYMSHEPIITMKQILQHRLSGVVGFIIVELGECKKYPLAYSINLICTRKKDPVPGIGSVLMAAYLYTILAHPINNSRRLSKFPDGNATIKIVEKVGDAGESVYEKIFQTTEQLISVDHRAVLELANAYTNPGGLCMYEKYGFQFDADMYSKCFEDEYNLPMMINFALWPGRVAEKQQKIIDITIGTDRGFPKSRICSIRDPREQQLLGFLKSILIILKRNKLYKIDNDASYDKFHEAVKLINGSHPMTIYEEVINYLESDPRDPTPPPYLKQLFAALPRLTTKGGAKRHTRKIKRCRKTKRNNNHCKKRQTKSYR